MTTRAVVYAIALAFGVAGCGGSYGPTTVDVPDVVGMGAVDAQHEIEAVGELVATFSEDPLDAALCTVSDQDEVGEVPPDTQVVLTLECNVEAPDVIGMPADEGQAEIEAVADLTVLLDPEPDDPALCEVEEQDQVGEVSPDAEILLTLACKVDVPDVVGQDADSAQTDLEAAGDVTVTLDPDPAGALGCSVADQSDVGPVAEGTDVTLYLEGCENGDEGDGKGGDEPPVECDPNYGGACLDPLAEDYDCAGGSGNGPEYVEGP
ncbi:MAG: hypothetical protein M3340_02350 [Actinomycetota bacterium]|nr:hypothetical protein [Actinomycetota bacterium]